MNEELQWIHWWHYAASRAGTDWLPTDLQRLSAPHLNALAQARHAVLARRLGVAPCQPCRPEPTLLALLCVPGTLALACELVAITCSPLSESCGLSAEERSWCERTAKALRPGQWLEPRQDSLALLRAWLDAPTWQRVRLSFARTRIEAVERSPAPQAAANRLDTLWRSACWKAGRSLAHTAPECLSTEVNDACTTLA
ncbi:hypothetical protein IAE35_21355 [Pseudomonas sp. S75]|uniref:hypothetical protein n=1 Tax=unclassified Pseudomonas TaxID=196821 RepID=UPI001904F745|nr:MULTISPECIES: hypothetical protein [unclassified Pseudomonas]MBJ9977900.1 hypothetical protein [Pseudomonas sp. S30]MBK0155894.1 hypothetical protein [Pseudomonas sp. S75]